MEAYILEQARYPRNNHRSESWERRKECLGVREIMKLTAEQKEELKLLVAESVRETLIQLGISSHDPIEMQKDMQHLREWRKSMDSVKSKSMLTLLTVVVSGMLAALWVGIKSLVVLK